MCNNQSNVTSVLFIQSWSLKDLGLSSVAQDQGSFVAGSLLATAPMSTEAISAMSKLIGEAQEHAFIQARAWGGAMNAGGVIGSGAHIFTLYTLQTICLVLVGLSSTQAGPADIAATFGCIGVCVELLSPLAVGYMSRDVHVHIVMGPRLCWISSAAACLIHLAYSSIAGSFFMAHAPAMPSCL